MTAYRDQPDSRYEDGADVVRVRAGRLWIGGLAAAIVGAGLAVVGYLIVKGLLHLPILGVDVDGAVAQPGMFTYAFLAAAAALAATGIMHLLLLGAPRPFVFFGWIVVIATILAMLVPLLAVGRLETGAATAMVNLVLGVVIGALVGTSAKSCLAEPEPPGPYGETAVYPTTRG